MVGDAGCVRRKIGQCPGGAVVGEERDRAWAACPQAVGQRSSIVGRQLAVGERAVFVLQGHLRGIAAGVAPQRVDDPAHADFPWLDAVWRGVRQHRPVAFQDVADQHARRVVVIASPGGALFRGQPVGGGRLDIDRRQAEAEKGVAQARGAGECDPLDAFMVQALGQQSDHGAGSAREAPGKMADLDDGPAFDLAAGAGRNGFFDRRVEILFEKQIAIGRAQAERAADVAIAVAQAEQARHEAFDAATVTFGKTLADECLDGCAVGADMLEQCEGRARGCPGSSRGLPRPGRFSGGNRNVRNAWIEVRRFNRRQTARRGGMASGSLARCAASATGQMPETTQYQCQLAKQAEKTFSSH